MYGTKYDEKLRTAVTGTQRQSCGNWKPIIYNSRNVQKLFLFIFTKKNCSLPVLEEKLHEPGNSLDKSAAHVPEGHVLLALVEEDVPELVLVHAVPPPPLHHHVVQLADHLVLELLQRRVSILIKKK